MTWHILTNFEMPRFLVAATLVCSASALLSASRARRPFVRPLGMAASGGGGGVSAVSEMARDVRKQMEEDEELNLLMQGLRGTNINDDDFASVGRMEVVQMRAGDDALPTRYEPETIGEYFAKRPLAVATRLAQIASVGGGFFASVALDAARGELQANEVERARQLRDVITRLGPFFIKLGQALSIRPTSQRRDGPAPAACDRVPASIRRSRSRSSRPGSAAPTALLGDHARADRLVARPGVQGGSATSASARPSPSRCSGPSCSRP